MALIAAHLNAGRFGGDSVSIGIYSPSSPTSIPLPPILPVPNKPYDFCGRYAPCLLTAQNDIFAASEADTVATDILIMVLVYNPPTPSPRTLLTLALAYRWVQTQVCATDEAYDGH